MPICYVAAFLLGAALSFGFAPFNFIPICFLSFSCFIYLQYHFIKLQRPRQAIFTLGFLFGLGYFSFSLYWIFYAFIILYADTINYAIYTLLSAIALASLFIYLSLYWGAASFITSFFKPTLTNQALAFACSLGLGEWLRAHLFSGFAWNLIGYSAAFSPLLMQIAAPLGIFGLTSLSILIYSCPVLVIKATPRPFFILISALLIILTDIAYGYLCLANAPTIASYAQPAYNLRLIQPSIQQSDKLNPRYSIKNFYTHLELSTKITTDPIPDLIIWPETAVNFFLEQHREALKLIQSSLQMQQKLLIGTPREQDQQIYNSAILLNKRNAQLAYSDKIHLVPFGEYIPYATILQRLFPSLSELFSGYSAGQHRQSVKLTEQQTYLPLICYEAIFPDEMRYSGPQASFIVNITNDAWYGSSSGPFQHFQQSRLRAVEQRLPLIRVANNGISAIIDPYGRIIKKLDLNKIGVLDSPLPAQYASIWGNYNSIIKKNKFNFLTQNRIFLLITAILGCLALFY
ncbi:apolipoprotein N-acyltransferase [Bartonella sp. TP]|uniref:apolipoprotein N-acyltransferase n=1 Tax=Bartonella sp. TP TaxID=3057550 RepID=UPI0025B1A180|nr:apolipoprotein N-acyltransferase [Bartonella sp. TP]WJW80392.1 apolipoprotein N-acyltransferase [Bartonella sp. TP]